MLNLVTATDAAEPEAASLAERFTALLADAAGEGITLDDERELHAAFLSASLAGEHDRCRQMAADAEARLGAARAVRLMEQQRRAAANEMANLRQAIESAVHSPPICFRPNWRSLLEQFVEAEAAGDVERCREIVKTARMPREPTAEEKSDAQAAATLAYERDQQRLAREAHLRALRERCAQGWNIVEEIEKHGTLRLGDDGAVLYSGRPLDDDVMQAIEWKAHDIRNLLRQRWHDRLLIAAPSAAAA